MGLHNHIIIGTMGLVTAAEWGLSLHNPQTICWFFMTSRFFPWISIREVLYHFQALKVSVGLLLYYLKALTLVYLGSGGWWELVNHIPQLPLHIVHRGQVQITFLPVSWVCHEDEPIILELDFNWCFYFQVSLNQKGMLGQLDVISFWQSHSGHS